MENNEVLSLDSIQTDALYENKLNSQLGKDYRYSIVVIKFNLLKIFK